MTSETIEEWAARKAPTLDAVGWRRCENVVARADVAHIRALLAYRDRVAAGLSAQQRDAFLRGEPEEAEDFESLVEAGIVGDDGSFAPFGREVARVLGEGE